MAVPVVVSALTIAGSDSGGGAGIQADLKTFAAHQVHGLSALAALTAQHTRGVTAVHVPPVEFLHAQVDACFEDFDIDAVKLGMLATAQVIQTVAELLQQHSPRWMVLDPVMVATSGAKLLQDFVTAYNAAINAINSSTQYDAENDAPSALTGDAQMRSASGQLRNLMGNLLGDLAAQGLDAKTLGLQTKGYPSSDGTLVFDSSKFTAALTADPEKIRAAFTGDTAFAGTLQKAVGSYIGTDGAFTLRSNGLNAQIKDVATQRTALDARMEAVGNRYKAQFVALDSMISQMNTTSSALAQQLASLTAQTG